jgi:hypothetical protein
LLVTHALQQCADGLQVFRSKVAYPTRGLAGVLVCAQLFSLRLMAQGDPSRRIHNTVELSAPGEREGLSRVGSAPQKARLSGSGEASDICWKGL